jgi:hypothetical protein
MTVVLQEDRGGQVYRYRRTLTSLREKAQSWGGLPSLIWPLSETAVGKKDDNGKEASATLAVREDSGMAQPREKKYGKGLHMRDEHSPFDACEVS